MKAVRFLQKFGLTAAAVAVLALGAFAQTENPPTRDRNTTDEVKTDAAKTDSTTVKTEAVEKTETAPTPTPTPVAANPDDKTPVGPQTDDADNILPYYNNYLKEYRLGPNDIISVEVFGQCPDYCKTGITVPPTARISYPLIREGVLVGGKTVEQVADEITKKLDEYIIDPKVTVTLDKAMSVRYSVMGKVAAPGIRIMDRKVSVYEAILEAGGIAKDGDKKKVAIISYDKDGRLSRRDINLVEMESGKVPMIFLNPGDQVFVGGKGFTIAKVFDLIGKASAVRLLFGSPF
ncbi:MAG: polysaccharide export protein [Acidobacteria bacterium]|nr:polysaccharide export protein [Acidobacteriota bacterium]